MNIELMKGIIMNLAEHLNCPNQELENMIGVSWSIFHDLVRQMEEEE